jgi:hypothetical protein
MACLWVVMLVVTLIPSSSDDAPPPTTTTIPEVFRRLYDLQERLMNAGTTTTEGAHP